MNHYLLMLALLAAVAVTACKPQAPAEPAPTTDAQTTVEAPAPVAVESAPAKSAADVPFDVKGFAGTFGSGADKITLNADGTYKLAGSAQGDGTWTAEENGSRIRLDPNRKTDEDRLYTVVSNEQIDRVDATGKAVEPAQSFKREAAAY